MLLSPLVRRGLPTARLDEAPPTCLEQVGMTIVLIAMLIIGLIFEKKIVGKPHESVPL